MVCLELVIQTGNKMLNTWFYIDRNTWEETYSCHWFVYSYYCLFFVVVWLMIVSVKTLQRNKWNKKSLLSMFYFYLLILLRQKRLGEFLPQEIPRNWKTSFSKTCEEIGRHLPGRNWKTSFWKKLEEIGRQKKRV